MGDRELDKWIHSKIFRRIVPTNHNISDIHCDCVPRYTESISDAFQIVEKMRTSHFKWFEMAHRPAGYICNFVGDPKYTEFAETAPLAICLAAKRVKMEGEKNE